MRLTHGVTAPRARARVLTAVVLAGGLLLAACGDDSSSGGSATTAAAQTTTTAAPATTAASGGETTTTAASGGETTTTAAASGPATGEPIKVMTIAPVNSQLPPYPNIIEAAKIYGKWINDNGGINGRPLEVITCDGRGDPNEDANCGRKAISEKVVAIVGSFSFDTSRLIPILEEGKTAWFGACCPIAAVESASKISFVIGSNAAVPAGAVVKMVKDGCKAPAVVYIETASLQFAIDQAKSAFKSAGFDESKAKFVTIPITAQDYSAQVAQAIDGTDCIYGGISDANWAAFLPAMQSLGGTQRLYGHQGNLNGKIAEQFPELTQNGIAVNSYPNIVAPVWKDYNAALEKYNAPDLDWNSLAGLGTWSGYQAFVAIVKGMTGEITNETFLDAASKATAVDTGGMVPVLDFTKEYTGQKGQFPRVFNRSVSYDVIKDGKLTPVDNKLYDMTNALDGLPLG